MENIKKKNRDNIILELSKIFNKSFTFENKDSVLNFLTLLYKLKELDGLENDHGIGREITFYRNWCQHAFLDRNQKTITEISKYIDEKIVDMRKKLSLLENEYPDDGVLYSKYYFWGEFPITIMSCVELKWDIEKILKEYGFRFNLNDNWWFSFRTKLLIALMHTPISFNLKNCPIEYINMKYVGFKSPKEISALESEGFFISFETKYDDKLVESFTAEKNGRCTYFLEGKIHILVFK